MKSVGVLLFAGLLLAPLVSATDEVRTRDGFATSQRGHRHNEVHYRRID